MSDTEPGSDISRPRHFLDPQDLTTRMGGPSAEAGPEPDAAAVDDAAPPHFPDRYAVLDELGRGGMGTVYRAYDKTLSREVAIKRLHRKLLSQDARDRLAREARAMAQLNHRNVVAVYDVTEFEDDPLVVMEYVRGQTLLAWRLGAERTPDEIVEAHVAAGRGLAAAHHAGVVHHDFKPGNVLVGADGSVKVTDFGLAKPLNALSDDGGEACHSGPVPGDETIASPNWAENVTRGGVVMGTPQYMAPEQHTGATSSPSSDQYAFCVTLAEALTGAPVFSTRDIRKLHRAKLAGPKFEEFGVSRPILAVLRRGLHPDPTKRFEDMDALLDALTPSPRKRRAVWGFAIAAAVAGGVAVGTLVGNKTPAPGPCTQSEQLMAEVWNDETREATETALLEGGADWTGSTAAFVLASFDSFAEDWSDAHRDACEDTMVRQEQGDRGMEVRLACLRQAKARFASSIATTQDLGVSAARRAPKIISDLPYLPRCDDVSGIDATFPEDPKTGASVEVLRLQLVAANGPGQAGETEEAIVRVEELLSKALEIGFDPLSAECMHALAALEATRDHGEQSLALNYGALELALGSGHTELAARILMSLTFEETRSGNSKAGDRLGRIAEGLAAPHSPIRGMAMTNRAAAALKEERIADGVALLRDAEIQLSRLWGPKDPRLAILVMNRGVAEERRLHFQSSYRYFARAEVLASSAYGDGHPVVIQIRSARANAMANLGAAGLARREREALLPAFELAFPADGPLALGFRVELGASYQHLGLTDLAEQTLRPIADSAPNYGRARLLLALVGMDRDDPLAIETAEDALALCEAEPTAGCDAQATWLVRLRKNMRQDPKRAVQEGEAQFAEFASDHCAITVSTWFARALEAADDPRAPLAWRSVLGCTEHAPPPDTRPKKSD